MCVATSVNAAEARLRTLLARAGFPEPAWQRGIDLGRPLGTTRPDCYFATDDPHDLGVCIYLDGLSRHIHGNAATFARDRQIREQLRAAGYAVFEIAATQLSDRGAVTAHFYRWAQVILGRDRARALRDDAGWFEERTANPLKATVRRVTGTAPVSDEDG